MKLLLTILTIVSLFARKVYALPAVGENNELLEKRQTSGCTASSAIIPAIARPINEWVASTDTSLGSCLSLYSGQDNNLTLTRPRKDLNCDDPTKAGFCVLVCAPVNCATYQLFDLANGNTVLASSTVPKANEWTWIRLQSSNASDPYSRNYTITSSVNAMISYRIYAHGVLLKNTAVGWVERRQGPQTAKTFALSNTVVTLTKNVRHFLPQMPCIWTDICYTIQCSKDSKENECTNVLSEFVPHYIGRPTTFNTKFDRNVTLTQWIRIDAYFNPNSPTVYQPINATIDIPPEKITVASRVWMAGKYYTFNNVTEIPMNCPSNIDLTSLASYFACISSNSTLTRRQQSSTSGNRNGAMVPVTRILIVSIATQRLANGSLQ